jgi:hypothetical protein
MPKHDEVILCTLNKFLFSPKGDVEGLLVSLKGKPAQICVPPHLGEVIAQAKKPGQRLRLRAHRDHSPKTELAAHPVYKFESFVDKDGHDIEEIEAAPPGDTELKGVVAALHYAKHGEPNGVILKSGAFIHLRPHGMEQTELGVGSRVTARGRLRTTVLGTQLLEARSVNRVELA